MNTKENAVADISLKEILAVIVRSGKKLIAGAVIFAILFAAFGAVRYYVLEEDPDKEYQIALDEYEMTKENLKASIERLERDASNQEEYNNQSLLMQIDPYNKTTTTMIFAISGFKLEEIDDSFGITEIPISYVSNRVLAQYMVLWNGLDLEKIVANTEYNGVSDKYLREVITLSGAAEGGVLMLTVHGNEVDDCEKIAQSIYAALQHSNDAVSKASYYHEFTLLNETITKSSIDLTLEQTQIDNANKLERYQVKVVEAQKKLLDLQAPSYDGGVKGVMVNLTLGVVVGMLLMIVWSVCIHLIKGKVSGAKQLSDRYAMPHFGTLVSKNGLWARLGQRVMGEKVWNDDAQAQDYIRKNCVNYLPAEGQIVVVTTLDAVDETAKSTLLETLGAQGNKVMFVMDVAHNPDALAAIMQSDGVVLAERAFASEHAKVKDLLKTVRELNKPVCGFVLL